MSNQEIISNLCAIFPEVEYDVIEDAAAQCDYDEEAAIELIVQITVADEEETEDIDTNELIDEEEKLEPKVTTKIKTNERKFTTLTEGEIFENMEYELKETRDLLHLEENHQINAILKFYRWNTEKVLQDYGDLGLDGILKKVGLLIDDKHDQNQQIGLCESCYEDDVELVKYDICGHQYCANCWKEYITSQINQGNSHYIHCMSFGCKAILGEEFLMPFIEQQNATILHFTKSKLDMYVAQHYRLKWCPNPHCGSCIKKLCDEDLHYVKCVCGSEFCFQCVQEPHFPATCKMYQEFLKIAKDTSKTVQLIKDTSRQCPSCKVGFIQLKF